MSRSLNGEVTRLNAQATSRSSQTGPRQATRASESARVQDLQQQQVPEETSPQLSSTINSSGEPNNDAGVVSLCTDKATATSIEPPPSVQQLGVDKSFGDAVKSSEYNSRAQVMARVIAEQGIIGGWSDEVKIDDGDDSDDSFDVGFEATPPKEVGQGR